jgi:hypothetical protein
MIANRGDSAPSDTVKFEYLVRRFPILAVYLSKRDRRTESKPSHLISKDSIIVFYNQQTSHQDVFSAVQQIHYRILGNTQSTMTSLYIHTRH